MKRRVINPVSGNFVDERTLAQYAKRAEQLVRQFAKHKNIEIRKHQQHIAFLENFCAAEFHGWLVDRKHKVSRNAWRHYKAAACHLLHQLVRENHPWVGVQDLENMKNEPTAGAAKKGTATSAKKKKGFSKMEQLAIENYLMKSINGLDKRKFPQLKYASQLFDLLHGNVHIGLRPQEYSLTFVEGNGLITRNGKYSEQRAHGEYRHLTLTALAEDVIESIRRTGEAFRSTFWDAWMAKAMELGHQFGEGKHSMPGRDYLDQSERLKRIEEYSIQILFLNSVALPADIASRAEQEFERISEGPVEKFYLGLRKNMRKVARRVFARRLKSPLPTIYSCRHQVTANLKHAGVSQEEIAAILGHKITKTHRQHYARKNSGESTSGLVKGDPTEIEKVRRFSEIREIRLIQNQLRKRTSDDPPSP